MKTNYPLKAVFFLFIFVTLFSCSKNDDTPAPEPPLLPVTSYKPTFNVTLECGYKVTDKNTGQILVDIDYGIDDVNTLVYVIHRQSDRRYVKLKKMAASSLKNITTNNIATVKDSLPEGKYYITFVAFKNFAVKGADNHVFFESLTQKYDEAVMQVPNDYIHYATTEFEVSAIDGSNKPVWLNLEKMTTDLIFEFSDADKVPSSSNYRLTVGVENIPSAFFIATGKTLSVNETEEKGLFLYSGEQNVSLHIAEGENAVVATFHSLSNNNLQAPDRGRYWFEFKENFNSGKQIRAVSEELGEFSLNHSSSMYIYGLYDKEQALEKSIRKTE